MQIIKEKKTDKIFRLALSPRIAQQTGNWVSPFADYFNGTYYGLNFSQILSEEEMAAPWEVTVQMQSGHNDGVQAQILTSPVFYSIQFNSSRSPTIYPWGSSESIPAPQGICTYSNAINGGQSAVFLDVSPEKNKPFYVSNLNSTNLSTYFYGVDSNQLVNFGNPVLCIMLTFTRADYGSGR